ncbi:putative fungal pheromone GPCR, STE3-type [Ganoderma leucocontextum]|nr:putative fungal pheromone GPCR, STE3-type [Ganoderma leucocontextum]
MTVVPLSFASFLAAAVVLVPLPGHWRARNIPTLSLIAWLFILNVAHGVNVIEWYDNTEIHQFSSVSKLVIGANMAIPAACFCLALRLEGIAAIRSVKTSHTSKRRNMLVDIAICVGLPMIEMGLHYIVQGHRFDIVERFGCQPEDYISLPEFFLIWFIPILLCLSTFVLGGLSFFHFFKRRATFARHLAASNTGLTPSRYFRLMAMSLALMIWNLLVFSLTLFFDYRNGLRPWTSWADVHSNWQHINRFPIVLIPADTLRWTYFLWWTIPVTSYIFFAFFAFGQDTFIEYGASVAWFKRNVLHFRPSTKGSATLPAYASFFPVGSSRSPRPPKFGTFALSSPGDEPYSPATATEFSQLSYTESPALSPSSTCILSYYELSDDKEVHDIASAITTRASDDDSAPPYVSSSSAPSTPTTLTIVPPPPVLVAEADNASIISQYAHSDRIV